MNKGLIIIGIIAAAIIGFILGYKIGKLVLFLVLGFNTAVFIIGAAAIITLVAYLLFKFDKSKG
jgi:hypothetical protein